MLQSEVEPLPNASLEKVRNCKKMLPSSMAGVDAHLSENVERLQLQKRQNLETSTSLLTPDIYCVLFFRDKVKSTKVTHTRWCKTNGDKKKK